MFYKKMIFLTIALFAILSNQPLAQEKKECPVQEPILRYNFAPSDYVVRPMYYEEDTPNYVPTYAAIRRELASLYLEKKKTEKLLKLLNRYAGLFSISDEYQPLRDRTIRKLQNIQGIRDHLVTDLPIFLDERSYTEEENDFSAIYHYLMKGNPLERRELYSLIHYLESKERYADLVNVLIQLGKHQWLMNLCKRKPGEVMNASSYPVHANSIKEIFIAYNDRDLLAHFKEYSAFR